MSKDSKGPFTKGPDEKSVGDNVRKGANQVDRDAQAGKPVLPASPGTPSRDSK